MRLLSNVKSKTVDNLRWISRVGSRKNKINKLCKFRIPDHLKNVDYSKNNLEKRINF